MIAAPAVQRQTSASKNKSSELQVHDYCVLHSCVHLSSRVQCSVLKLNDSFRSVSFELPECAMAADTMVSRPCHLCSAHFVFVVL
jgi:hypothetical protein